MRHRRAHHPRPGDVQLLLDLARDAYPPSAVCAIRRAYELAARAHRGQRRRSGDPYITHPTAVATFAVRLGAQPELVCAALLHDVAEDTSWPAERIRAEFGDHIAGVLDALAELDHDTALSDQRLDCAMRCDIAYARYPADVLTLKALDRLHNLRTIKYIPLHRQYRKARETREVIAPVAACLGLTSLSAELDQLARDILHPHFARAGLSAHTLQATAVLLPAAVRQRWREEWAGELQSLPTRHARARFVAQTVRGVPRLALTLHRRPGVS